MLRDAIEAERAECDQNADCARINAAIELAKKDFAALENRELDPEDRQKQWAAIRDQTIFVIRDVRHNIVRRANEAKETTRWLIDRFWRDDDDVRVIREFSAQLQEVPTRALLDYLRYLIQFEDLARIQSVRAVFAARVDHQRYRASFEEMVAQFALTKCGDLGERLIRICRAAEKTDAIVADLCWASRRSNGSHSSIKQRLPQLEAPMIDDLDIDAAAAHASCEHRLALPGNAVTARRSAN